MSVLESIKSVSTKLFPWQRGTRTVRYMFPALLGSLTALGLAALSVSSTDSYIFIESNKQAVEVGDIVAVDVFANAATPINAVELRVTFSDLAVDVFGVDRGESVITIWTEDPIIGSDSVTLRGGTFKRGFLGEHKIATVNFRAQKVGQHTIAVNDVRLIAGDGVGTEVAAVATANGSIDLFNFDESTSEEEIRVAVERTLGTDVDGDGSVTLTDISAFMGAWSNRTQTLDFNGDGKMTFRDFSIILADFFFQ